MMSLLFALAGLVPSVLAQEPPYVPCGNLPGCGSATNVLIDSALPGLVMLMLRFASGAAIIFIIVAGFQMLLALGDDSKYGTAKQAVFNVIMGLSLSIMSQIIISFVATEPAVAGITDDVSAFAAITQIMLNVFNGLFLVVLGYGALRMVASQGKEEEFTRGRSLLTYSIFGAVVVNIANAVVQAIASFFAV